MRLITIVAIVFCVGILAPRIASAQGATQATRGAAAGLQEKVAPLTTGPEDKREITPPGKIDADASREFSETKSGLKYRILRKGTDKKAKATDRVEVHYKGWLDNKNIFDSSYRRGETIAFGLRQVIPGWTEGMQLVGEGGMIELDIPYELGYGLRGSPPVIPPRAQLHFLVELIKVK